MAARALYLRPTDDVAGTGTLTASAEDPAYPAANLADGNPAKPGKLTTTSGWFRWDFGAEQRVDLVAIIHHNLQAGLEVRVQGNASDSWGAPTFDHALTIPAPQLDRYPTNALLDLTGLTGYSATGYRWWRLLIAGTNPDNVALGQVVIGNAKRTFARNINNGLRRTSERKTLEHATDFGVLTVYDLGVTVRRITGTINALDGGAELQALWRSTRGRVFPFLLVPFGDGTEPWLVRWASTMRDDTFPFVGLVTAPFDVEEVGRGLYL